MNERTTGDTIRLVLLIGGAIVILNVLLILIGSIGEKPHGPPDSSKSTSPGGLAAYAELLERYGHPVEQVGGSLAAAELAPGSTVMLIGGESLGKGDAEQLEAFVREGGTLVIAGRGGAPGLLSTMLDDPPTWGIAPIVVARPTGAAAETEGIEQVAVFERGSWRSQGEAAPLLDDSTVPYVLGATVGRGRLLLLSSAGPLRNARLDRLDNALFGVRLAGPPGQPVQFAEGIHGYGNPATGLAAIPLGAWIALAGLALAAGAFALARGRRLGPAEQHERAMQPARVEYVESLARVLDRADNRDRALEPLRTHGRELVARMSGVSVAGDRAELERQASAAGLIRELDLVERPARTREEIIALGQALARLERRRSDVQRAGRDR